MALIKTANELENIRESGKRLARVLDAVEAAVTPGVSTTDLDRLAGKLIREGGDTPSFLHYRPEGAMRPYPATLCISVNDEIVHGIPTERVLKEGDIVSIDLGLIHNGMHSDMARTVAVGKIDEIAQKLIAVNQDAIARAIDAAVVGARLGDIGAAVEKAVGASRFSIVHELGGHGIGKSLHEEPFVANFGKPKTGMKLQAGMALAIEPILTEGSPDCYIADDGYTFKTVDGKRASHFEHTIIVTENGPEIVTVSA